MKMIFFSCILCCSALLSFAGQPCTISGIALSASDLKCHGDSDGAISLEVFSAGLPNNPGSKGLIISEIMADPDGTDAPFEFVELVVTKFINFASTPYTVIFTNNNNATANGWVQGSNITYAFEINLGFANVGDVIYVGGSGMIATNPLVSIDYTQMAGAAGIGNVSASGVLGNGSGTGTGSADGVAVFNSAALFISPSSVPVDAVFFGTVLNNAVVNAGADGYQLPINDFYSGGKLQPTSTFINLNPISGLTIKLSGNYDVVTNTFTTPRTWVNNAAFSNASSDVTLSQPFTYLWSNGSTTKDLSNLSADEYCVTVTDFSFCQITSCVELLDQDSLIIQVNTDDVSCNGENDGQIELMVSGGLPPYIVNWSPISLSGELISGLAAGNYSYTLTDDVGCVISDNITLAEPDEIFIHLDTLKDISCFGSEDGEISVSVSGGIGNLDIVWNGGFSSDTLLQNLAPDLYEIEVTDDNNCTVSKFYTIIEPDEITVDFEIVDERCFGENNGQFEITNLSGGTGDFFIQYNIGSGIADSSGLATGIPPGTSYSIEISDNNGCNTLIEFDILAAENLTLSADIAMASTQTSADGKIVLSVSGGLPPYIFEWDSGQFEDSIGGLLPNIYCVDVIDDNGCIVNDCFEVDFPVGIEQQNLNPIFKVSQNHQVISTEIKVSTPQYLAVKIFNLEGQLMWKAQDAEVQNLNAQTNVSEWSKTIYLIQFQVNQKYSTQKIWLQ